jgi:hypothetical protein
MLDRSVTSRLRPVLTAFGLASLLALGACGGGSGAPNNPYDSTPATPPLVVVPQLINVYSGIPATLTVTSGVGPFYAFSQDPAVLPVTQNVAGNTIVLVPGKVTADTTLVMTVQDSVGQQVSAVVTVKFSPIFNSVVFAPAGGDCGASLCSGQSGTITAVATGPTGTPLASRAIRFDLVFGAYGINSTNPATPLVQTLTVTTDATGTAVAAISAQVNATTQPAQIRVTDVTSGQPQVANFTIVNNTIPNGSPLTVVPATATITSAYSTSCSAGFRIDYFIYGGNPPYTVSSTFPASVTLTRTPVLTSGDYFEATTNGACVDPLVFTIVDSAGKQVTSNLINKPGAGAPPPPATLAITPASVAGGICTGKTFTFVITGGSPSYNVTVSPSGGTPPTQIVSTSGGLAAISTLPSGVTTVTVIDAAVPNQVATATITCT